MSSVHASVVLLTYNQEEFVGDALRSLLEQDYADLQIVVSDDNSQDGTWQVVNSIVEAYTGRKRIVLNRNPENLGIGANYAKAFSLTTGDVVFSAAGDDVSLPTRCSETISAWQLKEMKADLVATDAFDMTHDGQTAGVKTIDDLQGWDVRRWFGARPYHFGASHMMTRRLLALNTLHSELNAEDQCLMFRSLLMGGALRLAKPLVMHRQNGVSYKAKPTTYALKKAKLISGAKAALIEAQQMAADAACLARSIEVEALLRPSIAINSFVVDVLTAATMSDRWSAVKHAKNVSFGKLARFFIYAAFPFLYMPGMWLKSKAGR